MITLIGMGSGTPESLTAQGLAALQNAGLILGAKRLLEQLPQGCTEHRKALYQPEDVLAALAADPEVDAALVYSGDTGFYSGAAKLLPLLRVLPSLSLLRILLPLLVPILVLILILVLLVVAASAVLVLVEQPLGVGVVVLGLLVGRVQPQRLFVAFERLLVISAA